MDLLNIWNMTYEIINNHILNKLLFTALEKIVNKF